MEKAPARVPSMLTVADIAKRLRISTKTVRRAIKAGKLHVHRVGRQQRIAEEDFAVFLAACRH